LVDKTPVDTPIVVFISSHQKEFQDLRNLLADEIDKEHLFGKLMMEAELVERRVGEHIRGDITTALKRAAIYVGLFGNEYSKTTMDEYLDARRGGICMLIFDIASQERGSKKRDPRVEKFLEEQVKGRDECRIVTLRSDKDVDAVLQRIANAIAGMVQQNLEIRKTTHSR
jgi:hypothetical protein